MKIVEVVWEDITGFSGWRSDSEIWKTTECYTVGFLIPGKKSAKNVIVAQSRDGDNVGNIMVIPKKNIFKIKVLRKA